MNDTENKVKKMKAAVKDAKKWTDKNIEANM